MNIYERYGANQAINAAGFATRLGGALIRPSVLTAMAEAAEASVDMTTLQAAASRTIARITGSEAGLVTSGATAALQLAAAACLARFDIAVMDRLPNTTGVPNEIIMFRTHRTNYDHALRASGAVIRDVGYNTRGVGAGGRSVESWEVETAIGPDTAALAATANQDNIEEIAMLGCIADATGLPLIVDAAAQLPPRENLRRFIDLGASLVAYSGGKALRGPQETGFLTGKRELIMSAALQTLDMDEAFDTWQPPKDFIDLERIAGLPQHGIGRGLKVSKEGVIGLLSALESFDGDGPDDIIGRATTVLNQIEKGLKSIPGLALRRIDNTRWGWPRLEMRVVEGGLLETSSQLSAQLKQRTPAIFLNEQQLSEGLLTIDPANILSRHVPEVIASIQAVCGSGTSSDLTSKQTGS